MSLSLGEKPCQTHSPFRHDHSVWLGLQESIFKRHLEGGDGSEGKVTVAPAGGPEFSPSSCTQKLDAGKVGTEIALRFAGQLI